MNTDYQRIARAIEYLRENVTGQPKLETVAAAVNLSPSHFQRLFTRWAGVSPKQYLQFLTVEYTKQILRSVSTLDATLQAGLSSTSRLHEHYIKIAAMTPAQYRSAGKDLEINYGQADSPFGPVCLATSQHGICSLAFIDNRDDATESALKKQWPQSRLVRNDHGVASIVKKIFSYETKHTFLLAPMGTNFQIQVWNALLNIPPGQLCTYKRIAEYIGQPRASRAAARAIAANPIACLIPCHRVLRSDGNTGGYHWGPVRKQAIIAYEAAQKHNHNDNSPGN